MRMSLEQTRETFLAYADATRSHEASANFFSDTIMSRMMNTGEEVRGRTAVAQQIMSLQARARAINPKNAIFGEGQAAVEIDFVMQDGSITPYSVIYDFQEGKITAIRFYFAGNVPG